MRRLYLMLLLFLGVYLDSILFARINIYGISPDAIMTVIVSFSILAGSFKGALMGVIVGLAIDALFYPMLGLNAMGYMIAGMAGGFFFEKYYADNLIIPTAVAAAATLVKESIMALAASLRGASFSYGQVLSIYILPTMAVTALLSIAVHLLMKRIMATQTKAERQGGVQTGGATPFSATPFSASPFAASPLGKKLFGGKAFGRRNGGDKL